MMAYVGHTSSSRLIAELTRLGIGEATQPGEFPPRRVPYFLDNGAYKDWTNGREFNSAKFFREAERAGTEGPTPDFIVCPDKIASPDSLSMSMQWVPRLRDFGPLALVVQDGMEPPEVTKALKRGGFMVLFVGGTLTWKFATLSQWVTIGHGAGVKVHCGRMGTAPRVRYARECGVDSVDPCTPLWSQGNMRRFVGALNAPLQSNMLGAPHAPKIREQVWTKSADRRDERESAWDDNLSLWE